MQVHPLVLPDVLTAAYAAPSTELRLLIRLVVAGVLAGILGWEREAAHKPAGFRTHMLVGIASLFTVLGLTTAASIWATAGVGIAAGSGYFLLATGSTLLLMLVLRGMARFDRDR